MHTKGRGCTELLNTGHDNLQKVAFQPYRHSYNTEKDLDILCTWFCCCSQFRMTHGRIHLILLQ